jgi:hypothetical protein
MRNIWLMILLAGLIAACTKPVPGAAIVGKSVAWNDLSLPGKTLTLVHPTKLQIFPFRVDFTTVATIGTSGADGAVAGPVLFWGIRENTLIISKTPVDGSVAEYVDLESPDSDAVAVLRAPMLDGDTVTALSSSGARVFYRLVQHD